jgi:hypothetical protein
LYFRFGIVDITTPLSYAAAAARADTSPVAADPGVETPREAAEEGKAEERTEVEESKVGAEAVLVFRPPPTLLPWSKFFSWATLSVK